MGGTPVAPPPRAMHEVDGLARASEDPSSTAPTHEPGAGTQQLKPPTSSSPARLPSLVEDQEVCDSLAAGHEVLGAIVRPSSEPRSCVARHISRGRTSRGDVCEAGRPSGLVNPSRAPPPPFPRVAPDQTRLPFRETMAANTTRAAELPHPAGQGSLPRYPCLLDSTSCRNRACSE